MLISESLIPVNEIEKLLATQDQSLQWFLFISIVVNGIFLIVNIVVQFRLKNKEKDIARYEKVQDRVIQSGSDMFDVMVDVHVDLNNFRTIEQAAQSINKVMTRYRHCKLFLPNSLCSIIEKYYNNLLMAIASSDSETQKKAFHSIALNLERFKKEFHQKNQSFR